MNDIKIRIAVRFIYSLLLLLTCYMVVSFMIDRQFAANDLQRWQNADSTVTESSVTDENMVKKHEKKYGKTVYYKSYTVSYAYTAEFTAWDKLFNFEYSGSNSGRTDSNAEEIPESAYNFPKQGDIIKVIYDPDKEGSYKLGSIDEWRKKAEFSFENLLVPCITLAIAAVMIIIDITNIKKRRAIPKQ